MPSFDIVSEINQHELTNAIDQANREIQSRFDFKDSNASFNLEKENILLKAASDFHVKQMQLILREKMAKRGLDLKCLEEGPLEKNLSEARLSLKLRQGIEQTEAKKINKLLKESPLKIQSSIQGDKIRVTGKKRDDLQAAMSFLKEAKLDIPLQYNNFRD